MSKTITSAVLVLSLSALSACNTTNQGERTAGGAAIGAAAGGIIGAIATDGSGGGAIGGALIGGTVGGLVGAATTPRRQSQQRLCRYTDQYGRSYNAPC